MQRISVYLNSRASHSSTDIWKGRLSRSLFRSELVYREPQSLSELHDFLDEDLNLPTQALISVGGDGTVHTLIQKLAHKDVGLLVIPGGTANDLASGLGHQSKLNYLSQCIRNKESKHIDLISINGRYMATNGGFGIGGEVAQKINHLRQKFPLFKNIMKFSGNKIYSFFIASELMSLELEKYTLELESSAFSGLVDCSALLINNQPIIAGTFNVAPETNHQDGLFNVTIIKHTSKAKLVKTMISLASGVIPENDADFITFETRSLKIKNKGSRHLNFFGDGEIFDQESKEQSWDIGIAPRALKLFSPCTEKNLLNLTNEVSLS